MSMSAGNALPDDWATRRQLASAHRRVSEQSESD
jgi:hypothetical protein